MLTTVLTYRTNVIITDDFMLSAWLNYTGFTRHMYQAVNVGRPTICTVDPPGIIFDHWLVVCQFRSLIVHQVVNYVPLLEETRKSIGRLRTIRCWRLHFAVRLKRNCAV